MSRILPLLMMLLLTVGSVQAQQAIVISDIRVDGLQRISAASVFASLPLNVGDTVDAETLRSTIRTLFRTGNFDDIKIAQEGSVLVILVEERPSISEINIEGNKAIETEALLEGLAKAGLDEGGVFKRSTLEGMRVELTRQYVSQGRYDASIDTDVVSLPRNRVAVNIDIDEGNTAAIENINIVGNTVFSDEDLLDLIELKSTGFWSWITSDDKYAKEKLSGDIETLTSFYMDRGYLQFRIDSTQVAVTPDKDAVYVTININEGEKYTVSSVELSGDLVLPEAQLKPFILVQSDQTYSQALVTSSEELLTNRLGNDGYNFAKVEGIPDIDEENRTVSLKFFIDPGKRTYVRRISFAGNANTADEVLRREMRQMEAAPASSSRIEQSRVRLDRLGFFKESSVETLEVPGSDDLIDLNYTVEEQPSGSIGASIGFSQDSGVLLGANIQQDNFLGTGKRIGIDMNKSDYISSIRFNYTNPYYTVDGVSRGFSTYYTKRDLEEYNVASYSANTLGAQLNFGYPLSEISRLGFGLGWENTEIEAGYGAVQEIYASPRRDQIPGIDTWFENQDPDGDGKYAGVETLNPTTDAFWDTQIENPGDGFLDQYGDTFDDYSLTTTWSQSTLNRGQLATRGAAQSLSFEFTVPGSDLEYYKFIYNGQIFFPITESWVVRLRTELGYGDGFGNLDELPFFQNFYSGGFGSVRGFESNTLGPRSTPAIYYLYRQAVTGIDADGDPTSLANEYSYLASGGELQPRFLTNERDPFGGNVLVEGSAELLFPLPFIKDQRSLRSAFFLDAGNVFSTSCKFEQVNCFDVDANELRYSVGVGLTWITGFGPLTFSLAKALNEGEYDETQVFQFSLGRSF